MEDDDSRYTKNLGRNLIIGLIIVYPATVGLCFAALGDLGQAAAIATVPAIFASPYVGILITLISAVAPGHASNESTVGSTAATTVSAVPVVSDAAAWGRRTDRQSRITSRPFGRCVAPHPTMVAPVGTPLLTGGVERRGGMLARERGSPLTRTGDVITSSYDEAVAGWRVDVAERSLARRRDRSGPVQGALAHPGRIRILEVLTGGERSVGEFQPLVGIELSHLSRQIAVQRRAGLVTPRKEGSLVFYAVRNDTVGELLGVAQRFLVTALSETSDLLADLRGAR